MIDIEESEEEFKLRLKKISDEIKADMKAGRYKHGVLHPDVKAKKPMTGEEILLKWAGIDFAKIEERLVHDAVIYGGSIREVYFDEAHYIKPSEFWLKSPSEPKEKDWDRKTFKSGPATNPSEEKRALLRANRKSKKGRK